MYNLFHCKNSLLQNVKKKVSSQVSNVFTILLQNLININRERVNYAQKNTFARRVTFAERTFADSTFAQRITFAQRVIFQEGKNKIKQKINKNFCKKTTRRKNKTIDRR